MDINIQSKDSLCQTFVALEELPTSLHSTLCGSVNINIDVRFFTTLMKICNQTLLTGLSLKLAPPVSCDGTLRKPGLPATNLIETKSKLMTVSRGQKYFNIALVLQDK